MTTRIILNSKILTFKRPMALTPAGYLVNGYSVEGANGRVFFQFDKYEETGFGAPEFTMEIANDGSNGVPRAIITVYSTDIINTFNYTVYVFFTSETSLRPVLHIDTRSGDYYTGNFDVSIPENPPGSASYMGRFSFDLRIPASYHQIEITSSNLNIRHVYLPSVSVVILGFLPG